MSHCHTYCAPESFSERFWSVLLLSLLLTPLIPFCRPRVGLSGLLFILSEVTENWLPFESNERGIKYETFDKCHWYSEQVT